jgi:hypothetical protein
MKIKAAGREASRTKANGPGNAPMAFLWERDLLCY